MAGVNKVILVGNVGNDPETRTLNSGSKVTSFSLATSESYTDKNGSKQESTEWHRVELWDNLANIAEQFVRKGSQLYVEGKIRSEKYTDQNGVERTSFKIRGLAVQLLGRREASPQDMQAGQMQPSYSPPLPTEMAPPPVVMASNSDDLPF
jgi:single-strand DNA-binding protein